ncbi:MAG: TonB-dependent receptor [Agarilytica sp.]
MKKIVTLMALSCAYYSSLSYSQDKLEEVVVTPTLTEKPLFEVMGSASLITQEDIAQVQPLDFSDILEHQAGLDLSRTGGRMSNTSLYTRGTNNGHTLILINGQRFSSATLGETQFQIVDPELVERIEIVRGSRSALYGSDAIGGVMQIFTKKPQDGFDGFLTAEAGTESTQRVSGGASDSIGKGSYSVALSREESDGIDSTVVDTENNYDDDPYEIVNANVFLGYAFSEETELTFSHMHSVSEADYDNVYVENSQPYTKNKVRVTNLDFDYSRGDQYHSKMSVGSSVDYSDLRDRTFPDADSSVIETNRESVYWQNDILIGDAVTGTIGLEYIDESVVGTTEYVENGRINKAFFSQLQWEASIVDFVIGGRHDDNSSYGGNTTGNFAAGVGVNENYRIYATWGQGFNAPSFNDLYWPGAGNDGLLPEESETAELGVKAQFDNFSYELSIYKNEIINLIAWAPIEENSNFWLPANVNEADIRGAEFFARYDAESWHLESSFTYVRALDSETDTDLVNRARRKLTSTLHVPLRDFSVGMTIKAQGKRTVSTGSIGGYGIVGLYAGYEASENLSVRLKLNNIGGKDYQLNERYNENGANGSLKLVYNF